MRRGLAALALALTSLAGCEDTSYRPIGAAVGVLVKRPHDLAADAARQRLATFGRKAIPQIETALHTAPVPGRLQLLAALEAIADLEAVPILRHFAVYDPDEEVRLTCEKILRTWVSHPGGRSAREALARITDLRNKGEGPTPVAR